MTTDLGIEGLEAPEEIGVGGFATVYKAYQPSFRRTVAVKVLAALNLDEAAKDRFERECHAMGALSDHPNIVTVYGAGFASSGRPYLVMAFLPGGSLADRMEAGNLLNWQDASLIGVHLAGALETAHRAGVIHRDIKPGNVLMSAYGEAQLTDFGIARISGGHETRSGVITASMAHAPPEVLDGQRPSVLADVYSLGSTIFELLYGVPAFQVEGDESMVPMLRRILTEAPPDLRQRGVPDSICRVIERSMAKDPDDRQQSAVEFGRELQAARRAEGLDAGKLTVPAEVEAELGAATGVSFVPTSTAICPSCSASLAPGAEFCGSCGAVVADVMRGGALPGAPAATPGAMTQSGVAAASAMTAQVYPPSQAAPAPAKKSKTPLLIGIAVLVLALLGGGAVLLTRSGGSGETATSSPTTGQGSTSDPTTDSTSDPTSDPTTASTAEASDYTPAIERLFIDRCAADNARSVCRCVYEEIRDTVPFERFKELNEAASSGQSLENTEIPKILQGCVEQNPGDDSSSTTSPTIGGLDSGQTG